MLDTSTDLDQCAQELGAKVEQLLTPLTCFSRQKPQACFSIDNGAFSHFQVQSFLALLAREYHARHLCRFVAVPDVVGSARRTCEVFDHWWARKELQGWPLAFVAQDGQEDLPIPWALCEAVFIGGSTAWKCSSHTVAILKAAQALGKWTHVGRVNSPLRWEWAIELGINSIDGTGLARFSHMRESIRSLEMTPRLL